MFDYFFASVVEKVNDKENAVGDRQCDQIGSRRRARQFSAAEDFQREHVADYAHEANDGSHVNAELSDASIQLANVDAGHQIGRRRRMVRCG